MFLRHLFIFSLFIGLSFLMFFSCNIQNVQAEEGAGKILCDCDCYDKLGGKKLRTFPLFLKDECSMAVSSDKLSEVVEGFGACVWNCEKPVQSDLGEVIENFGPADESAEDYGPGQTDDGKKTPLENPLGNVTSVPEILGGVLFKILGLVGSLVLLVFVYGGFIWLTSAGNAEHVKKGTSAMLWAVIGLFIIFGSYGILILVFNFFE